MRGPSRELRVIFAEEFRQQLRRPNFLFFTGFFAAVMLVAIPVTPLIVDLIQDDDPAGSGVEYGDAWNDESVTGPYRGIVEAGNDVPAEEDWLRNPANGHYYRLTEPMDWMQAEAQASDWGGHLVTVSDREEELWLREQFGAQELFWLGFNDLAAEGNWEWVSEEPAAYANWASGQPDDYNANEDAAVMNWGGWEGEAPLERIGYVDRAGVLTGAGLQDWPKLYGDRAEGIQAVEQGEIDTLFVLPADYLESGEVEEYEPAKAGRNLWGSPAEWSFVEFLRAQLTAGQLEGDLLTRVLNPASYHRFEVEVDGAVGEEVTTAVEVGELVVPILFGVLLTIAVLSGSGALLRTVSEEKETRMIELLVTSASPLSLMTGKLLAAWTAGLIQIAVWVGVGAYAMPEVFHRIPGGGELTIEAGLLATVVLSFVLGYFLFSVLAMFIGTVVTSTHSAQQYTGLMSLLVASPFWFIGLWLNVAPDNILAQIFTYSPFTAPTMLMIRNAMGDDMSGAENALALGIVAITALLLLWVAARVFRAGILLSGQRIRPRNVWMALRHAD
jgi:ABC-2 type transport system permease protein